MKILTKRIINTCGRAAVETLRGLLWEQEVSFRRSTLNATFYLSLVLFIGCYAFGILVPLLFFMGAELDMFGDYTVPIQIILREIDWNKLQDFVHRMLSVTVITFIFAVLEAIYTFVEILRREIRELDLLDPLSGRQEVLAWLILISCIFFFVPLIAVILNEFTIGKHGFNILYLRLQNIRPPVYWDVLDWSLFLGFRFPCWLFFSFIFFLDPLIEVLLRTSFWRSFTTINNRKEGIIWVFFLALMFCLLFLAAFVTNFLTVGVSYEKIYLRLQPPSFEHLFCPDILDVGLVLLGFFVPLGCFLFLVDPIIEFIINKAPLKPIRRIGFIFILGGMLYGYFYRYADLYSLLLWLARRAIELRFTGEYNNLSDLSAHKTFMDLFTYSPLNFQVEMGKRITEGVEHHISDGDGILLNFQTAFNYVSSCTYLANCLGYSLLLVFLIRFIQLSIPNLSFLKLFGSFFISYWFVFFYLGSAPRGFYLDNTPETLWNPFLVHLTMITCFIFIMIISNRFSARWQLYAFLFFPALELFLCHVTYQELMNRNHFLFPYILPHSWFSVLDSAIRAQIDPLFFYDACMGVLYDGMIAFWILLIFGFLDSLAPFEKEDEKYWLSDSAINVKIVVAGVIFVFLIALLDNFANFWIDKSFWRDLSAVEVIRLKSDYLKFDLTASDEDLLEKLEAFGQFSVYKPTLLTVCKGAVSCLAVWPFIAFLLAVPLYSLLAIGGFFFAENYKKWWMLIRKAAIFLLHLDLIIAILYPYFFIFHLIPWL